MYNWKNYYILYIYIFASDMRRYSIINNVNSHLMQWNFFRHKNKNIFIKIFYSVLFFCQVRFLPTLKSLFTTTSRIWLLTELIQYYYDIFHKKFKSNNSRIMQCTVCFSIIPGRTIMEYFSSSFQNPSIIINSETRHTFSMSIRQV